MQLVMDYPERLPDAWQQLRSAFEQNGTHL